MRHNARRRVIAVVNQKGGVGKTAIATNLAAAVGQHGGEVLAIDSDRQGNMATQLLPDGAEHGLDAVYAGTLSLADASTSSSSAGVDVVVPGASLAKAELGMAGIMRREIVLQQHVATLDARTNIIIDCPPNLGLLAVNALMACTDVLIPVSMQDSESVTGLADVIHTLHQLYDPEPLPPIRAIVNRHQRRRRLARRLVEGLAEHQIPCVTAVIPELAMFHQAPDDAVPAIVRHPDSVPAVHFRQLADELRLV